MATFEDTQKANEAIKTTGIEKTNKKTGERTVTQYAPVNQRVKAFRMVYPMGRIETQMLSNSDGVCIFRAVVAVGDMVLGTGTACEEEQSSFINKTSYIENCETSAVGRALGMAGFGIDTSLSSYEEAQTAINNQEREKATKEYVDYILNNCTEEELRRAVDKYGDLYEMPMDVAVKTVAAINKRNGGIIHEEN